MILKTVYIEDFDKNKILFKKANVLVRKGVCVCLGVGKVDMESLETPNSPVLQSIGHNF